MYRRTERTVSTTALDEQRGNRRQDEVAHGLMSRIVCGLDMTPDPFSGLSSRRITRGNRAYPGYNARFPTSTGD
jgi:hypothetical protein